MIRTKNAVLGALLVGLASLPLGAATVEEGLSKEVFLIQEKPDAKALASIMFPHTQAKKPKFKLRGIRFSDDPAQGASAPQTSTMNESEAPEQGMAVGFNISFDVNSTRILPATQEYLDAIGEMMVLEQTSGVKLMITGHADASGEADYNLNLSEGRAKEVAKYLTQKFNIEPDRIMTKGFGETSPLPKADPFDGLNRRVEFHPL
ncbi:OmpA family protein [Pseudomaricurvus alkylphenolicus]|uniref:OmpA family protein n=1 Tax=Pseudomaricurvus alkylphenolicus TaxID=1306991 RepID=UPI00141F87C6|nr:OmpA family protein [Pseudomaricurvus alkylphenolicus]NIB40211.1 OmpA family protein [Pseudomaricurvus alkylphenolicus]